MYIFRVYHGRRRRRLCLLKRGLLLYRFRRLALLELGGGRRLRLRGPVGGGEHEEAGRCRTILPVAGVVGVGAGRAGRGGGRRHRRPRAPALSGRRSRCRSWFVLLASLNTRAWYMHST